MPDQEASHICLSVSIHDARRLSPFSTRTWPSGWEHSEYIKFVKTSTHKSARLSLQALVETVFPAKPADITVKHSSARCHPDQPSLPAFALLSTLVHLNETVPGISHLRVAENARVYVLFLCTSVEHLFRIQVWRVFGRRGVFLPAKVQSFQRWFAVLIWKPACSFSDGVSRFWGFVSCKGPAFLFFFPAAFVCHSLLANEFLPKRRLFLPLPPLCWLKKTIALLSISFSTSHRSASFQQVEG